MVANSGKTIGVIDFDLICLYKEVIDNPKPFFEIKSLPVGLTPLKINPQDIKKQFVTMEEKSRPLMESNSKNIKMEQNSNKK